MTEQNQLPPPPPPPTQPPPAPQQAEPGAELERVRSGNRILKIVAAVLAFLFLLTAGAAFFVYRKVTQAKASFAEAFNALPAPAQSGGTGAAMPQSGFAMFTPGQGGGDSSLNLVSGGVPGALPGGLTVEDGERIRAALLKYEKRPIVQEFIADMKKNPDMAKAFAEAGAGEKGNPLAVISSIRNARGMESLIAKYAARPEFLSLMMDVMKDPALKGLMSGAQGMPQGLPQQGVVPASRPVPQEQAEEGDGEAPKVLDPSVISGGGQAPAVKTRPGKAPPPVDSD